MRDLCHAVWVNSRWCCTLRELTHAGSIFWVCLSFSILTTACQLSPHTPCDCHYHHSSHHTCLLNYTITNFPHSTLTFSLILHTYFFLGPFYIISVYSVYINLSFRWTYSWIMISPSCFDLIPFKLYRIVA